PKSELNRHLPGNGVDVLVFRNQHAAQRVTPALREARMPKKRADKQQNQGEPPVSLGARHMPQPAPVDNEAFARRAGKSIGNSNTWLEKGREGGNRGLRGSG